MIRRKIEISFGITLLILTLILFKTTTIYKNNLIEHSLSLPLFSAIIILFILFNYRILKLKWITNLIYSTITVIVSFILSSILYGLILFFMLTLDGGTTPLGWTFNYLWFTAFIFGLLLIVITELIGVRMAKKQFK